MKYTLLELTQRVLSSIKGEEINSISDTAESLAVVDIIKECYATLIAQQDFPEQKTLFSLVSSGDSNKPVLMTIPEDAYGIEWLKYNGVASGDTDPVWQDVKYLQLKDFLDYTQQFNTSETDVSSMSITLGDSTISFKYRSDGAPKYFTTIDDNQLLFDSYDTAVDSTLQSSKTIAYGLRISWTTADTYTPDLDSQQFAILLKDAKAMAWQELKSVDNVAAARQGRDLRIAAEYKKTRANYKNMGYYYDQYPNYGRK